MAELTDTLNQLLESHAGQISQRINADPAQTRTAIDAAVPALLAALGNEAERGEGLKQAIAQDHDGSIIDQLSGYLDGSAQLSPRTTNGSGILDHALGDQQQPMAQALSAKTGLDMGTIMRLLPLLAPIVMGMLGKKSSSSAGGSDDGFGLDDLGSILGREKQDARSKNPDIGDILDSFSKGSGTGSKSGDGGIGDVLGGLFGNKEK